MDWIIIPGALTIIFVILVVSRMCFYGDYPVMTILSIFLVSLMGISWIVCPANYYQGLNDNIQLKSYYDNITKPNVISETDEYVVVSNVNAGIWQAGGNNVVSYNSMLASRRYWDDKVIIGSVICRPPEYLKYVQINGK
jgi:hypothetical protein